MSVRSRIWSLVRMVSLAAVAATGCTDESVPSTESAPVEIEVSSHNVITITPVAKINFQPDSAPVPPGYTKQIGSAFAGTAPGSSGWVRQDSLSGTHVPFAATGATRDRNRAGIDQKLDTLIHMQQGTPVAFEYVVTNGTYRVTVSAGDQPAYDSSNVIRVEGTTAISNFVGSTAVEYRQATVDVVVSDGRLTIDAIGGTNTKLNYLDISRVTDDAPPEFRPSVRTVRPADGEMNVALESFIEMDVNLPNPANVDQTTLTTSNVFLSRNADNLFIPVTLSIQGSGDIIRLTPTEPLLYATVYRVTLTENLRDTAGAQFVAFTSTFTVMENLRPSVRAVNPVNGAAGVNPTGFVSADVNLPNVGGIDETTMTTSTVYLAKVSDGIKVGAVLNTSGGGDVIVLQPTAPLAENTAYRFTITDQLRDTTGVQFLPFTSTFTTGTTPPQQAQNFQFEKVSLGTIASGRVYTSLTIGPDGRLYAATLTGEIIRFNINADGTLTGALVINTVRAAEGGNRAVIGLAFDPSATSTNLILWVTHTVATLQGATDWTSKIAKLTGASLETLQSVVVGLPRSTRDHLTNSIAFKPGEPGNLYISQGSITAMGAPDNAWGLRPEHLLAAAVLKLETAKLTTLPLDVKTEEGGTYNPFSASAPLTLFATGVRNAYDLVWHSNGQLYLPTNGSAAGGNAPGTPSTLPASCANRIDGPYTGPSVPALNNVGTESDYLYRVVAGGYYGHPNPTRCEWVMNGGNPTSGNDSAQRPEYPVGTQPDRNWRGHAFDFGEHFSPNGVIEYKHNFFGTGLQGKLIVARYSGGDDLVVLTLDPTTKNVIASQTGATGMGGFADPLDVVENTTNGHLYVSEHAGQKITLLRPTAPPPTGGPVPAPWTTGDIGSVSPAGSATYTANTPTGTNTFTVKGAGADIYGTADAFHFVRQSKSGDFTLSARVTSLGVTDPFAKAGVMVRESTAAGSRNAFMTLTPSNGAKFTTRTATGATTNVATVAGLPPPNWVRVQRIGNTFKGFVSTNGSTWTQVGATTTISMPASVLVGLAVTSHKNGTLTTATFTNVTGP